MANGFSFRTELKEVHNTAISDVKLTDKTTKLLYINKIFQWYSY